MTTRHGVDTSAKHIYTHHRKSQSLTHLCNPMDHSLPGSSVHGILQVRIVEWVTISFCRASSQPRDQILVSCITGRFFTTESPGKSLYYIYSIYSLYILCIDYKKSFLPDNHYFFMSDFRKTKASKEMTDYIMNRIPKVAYSLPRP